MLHDEWRKSSYSGGSAGNCVEARIADEAVQLRDTQNRELGRLAIPAREWAAFLAGINAL
jgi:hypothetical protein